MRKRTKVLIAALGLIGVMILLTSTTIFVAISSDWGHSQVRNVIESTVRSRLVSGATFRISRLRRDHGSTWVADSIELTGADGHRVVSIRQASIEIALVSVLRGDIRLGTLALDGARISIEQARDGSWNTQRLFAKRTAIALDIPLERAPNRRVVADSVVVRDSRVELTIPEATANTPSKRRTFDKISIAAGKTTLLDADDSGHLPFSALTVAIDDPPVTVTTAMGAVSWWKDSLRINVPRLRLPASRASVTGTVSWLDHAKVALEIVADSIAPADIRWMSALIPSEGTATARVTVRLDAGTRFRYDITEFDLKAFDSHLSGRFAVTPGPMTNVRDLQIVMRPLDLALVRNVFGDTILKKTWQGAIDGTLAGRGGNLDRLVIDSVVGRFIDARIGGATSRFAAAGAINVAGARTELIGMQVRIDSLDVRTLGAVARTADSLSGALKGSLILDGPTANVTFRDMRMRLVDGARTPSVLSGFGRVASDVRGHWMDATLTLDTVAIASLVPDSLGRHLRGAVGGTLVLGATADTMTVDARLKAGDATIHLTGTTLLDSLRTLLDLRGTIAGLDVRNFVARKDIPAHALGGSVRVTIDQSAGHAERHLELQLDSTSRVAESRLSSATIRFGSDSTGIHLDTADVRAGTWRVEARGQLAARGHSTTDSITFATEIDSLGVLTSILLDSLGAPRVASLGGRLRTSQGVLKGSFEHATLTTDLGATDLVIGPTSIRQATGSAQVENLPDSASGFFRGTIVGLANGRFMLDTAQLRADILNGQRARVTARAAHGDSIDVTFGAEVTWPDSSYTVRVDSLEARFRGHRWILALPMHAQVNRDMIAVDSLAMRSDHGALVIAAGRIPERGSMDATVQLRRLGFEELGFLGLLPADMTGMVTATARVTGTRDAPTITVSATVDSIQTEGSNRPSVRFEGTYANKKANVSLSAISRDVRVLDAKGDIPVDLTLRGVENRVIDGPMSLQVRGDSVALSTFDGLLPRLSGLAGNLTADVNIGGTVRRPRGSGSLSLSRGAFDLRRYGIAVRDAHAEIHLAGDSVLVKRLRVSDGDSPTDTAGLSGVIHLTGRQWTEWGIQMQSTAHNFRVVDDPRLATAEANWALNVRGQLFAPRVTGSVDIPYAVYTIGPQRRQRTLLYADSLAQLEASAGVPNVDGVLVNLGHDVRLKSRDANVQLTGSVELIGVASDPWISGVVTATRGTYRVRVGPITRSFRVDSGSVIIEGTKEIPASLDIYTSYLVRRPDEDDVTIRAHVYGMTDRPRLDLTSDLGSATSQSEIISYLVFGKSTFGIEQSAGNRDAATTTATAALLPTLGGIIEATLGTVLPFFSTLQVTSTAGEKSFSTVKSNPIDGLLNSYAVTGGRQFGSDAFLSLSTGRCSASSVSSSGSAQFWFGAVADYRPKRTIGASVSVDPGPAPCNRLATEGANYQFGLDLSYDWKFGKKKP